jgi:hypothetical protein
MKLLFFVILLTCLLASGSARADSLPGRAWLLSLPFRVVGIAVDGVFDLLRAILTLSRPHPARHLGWAANLIACPHHADPQ